MQLDVQTCRLQQACQTSADAQQAQCAMNLINEEVKAVQQYQQALSAFDAADFGEAKPAQSSVSPARHDVHRPQSSRQMVSRPPASDADSAVGAPRSRPGNARVAAQSKRPPPSRDWKSHQAAGLSPRVKGVAAKADNRRANLVSKPPAPAQQPWDSWTGQDKDLAANLADDIMEASPGVTWNDIAGLHDAKRILQVLAHASMCSHCSQVIWCNLGQMFFRL
jgi:hypothetical protein